MTDRCTRAECRKPARVDGLCRLHHHLLMAGRRHNRHRNAEWDWYRNRWITEHGRSFMDAIESWVEGGPLRAPEEAP